MFKKWLENAENAGEQVGGYSLWVYCTKGKDVYFRGLQAAL
jgi:hypothetical protein